MQVFTFSQEWQDHAAPIYALTYFKKNCFFTGGADKIVALWDINKKENLPFHIKVDFGIYHLHFEVETNYLFISQSKGGVHIINTIEKKEIAYLLGHKKGVYKTLVAKNYNVIICLGGDGLCSFWNLTTFKHIKTIPISSGKLRDALIQEDSVWITCGNGNLTQISLLDFDVMCTIQIAEEAIYTALLHPKNGNILLCAGKDALIYAVNIITKQTFSFPAHNFGIYKLIAIPNSNMFISCSRDKSIKVWNIQDYSFIQKLSYKNKQGHTASVNNILFDTTADTLISIGDDKRIIAWKFNGTM